MEEKDIQSIETWQEIGNFKKLQPILGSKNIEIRKECQIQLYYITHLPQEVRRCEL